MRTLSVASVTLAAAVTLAPALGAQAGSSIARRVAAAPDGEVRLTYATRSNVCGDGRDGVTIGRSMYFGTNTESYGGWSNMRCEHGPARVTLTVEGHRVVGVRTRVAGSWSSASSGVTDLGTVPAAEAAAYFLSIVPALDEGGRARNSPMLAAAVADSANVAPEMLRLGRTASLSRETRRRAVHWSGALGDASMVAPLVELARSSGKEGSSADDVGPGNGLEGAAAGALSAIPDDAGVPALTGLARDGSESVRKAAVFWLGQRDDEKSRAVVRTVAANDKETDAVRKSAIFALSQGEPSKADEAFLESLFNRVESETLKDRVLFSVSQRRDNEGTRWLLAKARDDQQPIEVRRKAVFWAGQGDAKVADLKALYTATSERRLREHVIFVLSQRNEEAATNALIEIVRNDADRDMRKKALFWLAQKDDPRVRQLITDLVVK
ncbi:MAG TPA: HEAT repeat domain-containing protein [Gemmatimonadaceae bacterium]